MEFLFYVVIFTVMAAVFDYLIIHWRAAADSGDVGLTIIYGVFSCIVHWIPIVIVIDTHQFSALTLALCDVAGTIFGTIIAMNRLKNKKRPAVASSVLPKTVQQMTKHRVQARAKEMVPI